MLTNEYEKYIRPNYLSPKKYNIKADVLFDLPRPEIKPSDFIIALKDNTFSLCWKHNGRVITHYKDCCYSWKLDNSP
jgi:hypothetical protein